MLGRDHWMARLKPIGTSAVIPFDRTLSPAEAKLLRAGSWPQDMDTRWGAFLDSTALQIFRSWSGHCIYSLPASAQADQSVLVGPLHVNADSAVYRRSGDAAEEIRLATAVLAGVLDAKA